LTDRKTGGATSSNKYGISDSDSCELQLEPGEKSICERAYSQTTRYAIFEIRKAAYSQENQRTSQERPAHLLVSVDHIFAPATTFETLLPRFQRSQSRHIKQDLPALRSTCSSDAATDVFPGESRSKIATSKELLFLTLHQCEARYVRS
jgi:hypothetical protein